MFRKVLIPSAIKLSGPRTFTSLTRSIATRVTPNTGRLKFIVRIHYAHAM